MRTQARLYELRRDAILRGEIRGVLERLPGASYPPEGTVEDPPDEPP